MSIVTRASPQPPAGLDRGESPAPDAPVDYVLIVDDDVDLRQTLCDVLNDEQVATVGAGNGQEALTHLLHNPPPRLILLDLMMPVMNGWEFRAVQRSDPRLADLPIAVLSGDNEVAQVAAQLGAAGYLSKPISLEALLALVAAHQGRPKI